MIQSFAEWLRATRGDQTQTAVAQRCREFGARKVYPTRLSEAEAEKWLPDPFEFDCLLRAMSADNEARILGEALWRLAWNESGRAALLPAAP